MHKRTVFPNPVAIYKYSSNLQNITGFKISDHVCTYTQKLKFMLLLNIPHRIKIWYRIYFGGINIC